MLKRNDIIERLNARGYTKKDAAVIINDLFGVITDALIKGEAVQIHGFGTFEVKEYAERKSVGLSQEDIIVPAYKAPKFTAGILLKRAVKEGFVRE